MELSFADTFSGFASGLVGALVGGAVSLYTTHKSFKMDRAQETAREEKEVQNLLIAMQTEMATLWEFHQRKIGHLVEGLADEDILEFYYPLTQDYFTIYHATAAFLGKIRNEKLRKSIVVCYNKCKKVVDAFKYNNDLILDYRALLNLADGTAKIQKRIEMKHFELQEVAKLLKEDHYELKGYVEELITLITQNHAALLTPLSHG